MQPGPAQPTRTPLTAEQIVALQDRLTTLESQLADTKEEQFKIYQSLHDTLQIFARLQGTVQALEARVCALEEFTSRPQR